MAYCTFCGAQVADNMHFCPDCGAKIESAQPTAVPVQDAYQKSPVQQAPVQPGFQQTPVQSDPCQQDVSLPGLTKKDWYKHPNNAVMRKNIKSAAITLVVFASLWAFCSFVFTYDALLDFVRAGYISSAYLSALIGEMLLVVGLSLGAALGRSRVCSIILLVILGIELIFQCYNCSQGWGSIPFWTLALVIDALYVLINNFVYAKAYKEYQSSGVIKFTPVTVPVAKNKRK